MSDHGRSDGRTEPPHEADERATLLGFLQYHRDTLALKCAGLTDEQLRLQPVPPSNLSLLGLVRHMAEVERGWFGNVLAGEIVPPIWSTEAHWDADFDVDGADVADGFAIWRRECARSAEIVAKKSLDDVGLHRRHDEMYSVRWVLTHMIEEYARHNGHADLLRECIDGVTGE